MDKEKRTISDCTPYCGCGYPKAGKDINYCWAKEEEEKRSIACGKPGKMKAAKGGWRFFLNGKTEPL